MKPLESIEKQIVIKALKAYRKRLKRTLKSEKCFFKCLKMCKQERKLEELHVKTLHNISTIEIDIQICQTILEKM